MSETRSKRKYFKQANRAPVHPKGMDLWRAALERAPESPSVELPVLSEPVVPPSDAAPSEAQSLPTLRDPRGLNFTAEPQLVKQEKKKPLWEPKDNSIVREKALHIIAMRMGGLKTPEIAKALELSEHSVNQYVYLAGKHGWLVNNDNWADPNDRLEYELSHKVVRNLDEMLDSPFPMVRQDVTLEVAKGTLFKKFNEQSTNSQPVTMIAIKVEMPTGVQTTVREGTTGGVAHYTEGHVVPNVES